MTDRMRKRYEKQEIIAEFWNEIRLTFLTRNLSTLYCDSVLEETRFLLAQGTCIDKTNFTSSLKLFSSCFPNAKIINYNDLYLYLERM